MAKAKRGSARRSGAALIRALEQTFGVGIMVDAVDDGPPVSISVTVLYGGQSGRLVATGETETEVWRQLGVEIASWRAANDKHVAMWGGGF